MTIKGLTVGFIGGGNMGEALIKGLLEASLVPATSIHATDVRLERLKELDRLDLARELDKRARARARTVDVLVEVNLAGETSKGGVSPEGLGELLDAVAKMPALTVKGLMAIPPEARQPDDSREWFRALRKLGERHGFSELSMGMSGDFEVAIEEGATMVRVGTAIFGPRPPRPEPGAEAR